MTIKGALSELNDLLDNEDIPFYVKPAIKKVIETIEMDAQEIRYGEWKPVKVMDDESDFGEVDGAECSVCGNTQNSYYWAKTYYHYCPNCGSKMDHYVSEIDR